MGTPMSVITSTVSQICNGLLDEAVCDGFIEQFKGQVQYLLRHDKEFSGGKFCALFVGGQCGDWEKIYNFDIDFSGRKKDVKPKFVKPEAPKVIAFTIETIGNLR